MSQHSAEAFTSEFNDDAEGLHGFKWQHFDLVSSLRGDAAIKFADSTDFRIRAIYHQRETLLNELAFKLLPLMGPSAISGREAGDVYKRATKLSPTAGVTVNRTQVITAMRKLAVHRRVEIMDADGIDFDHARVEAVLDVAATRILELLTIVDAAVAMRKAEIAYDAFDNLDWEDRPAETGAASDTLKAANETFDAAVAEYIARHGTEAPST